MLLQYFFFFILAMAVLGLCCIAYEWIRYESGWFKPMYSVEQCDKQIRFLKENIERTNNDKVLTSNIQYRDDLNYWEEELKKAKKWQLKHS